MVEHYKESHLTFSIPLFVNLDIYRYRLVIVLTDIFININYYNLAYKLNLSSKTSVNHEKHKRKHMKANIGSFKKVFFFFIEE